MATARTSTGTVRVNVIARQRSARRPERHVLSRLPISPLNVGGSGVLANDLDVDGDRLQVILLTRPHAGQLTLHSDGTFDYVVFGNFMRQDSFRYAVTDGISCSVNPRRSRF